MPEVILRLKSGREFRFSCREFEIETSKLTGELISFSFKGGVGECPIFFRIEDVESISRMAEEVIE